MSEGLTDAQPPVRQDAPTNVRPNEPTKRSGGAGDLKTRFQGGRHQATVGGQTRGGSPLNRRDGCRARREACAASFPRCRPGQRHEARHDP